MNRLNSKSTQRTERGLALVLVVSLCSGLTPVAAQEAASAGSRGSYTLAAQFVRESDVATNVGLVDIGTSDTQALLFSADLSVTEKWDFYVSLPFIRKRYNGDSPHDPNSLDHGVTDEPFIDDGDFHGDFQDFAFGFRYTLPVEAVSIQPFIGAGIPASDYPIFAHAAVGQNLQRLDVGVRFDYLPPFSNFYYSFTLAKAFVEQIADVNVDHWRFDGEIGYFVNPRLAVRGYFLTRQGNGLRFPDDFPPPRDDLHWYEHEGVLAREFTIIGAGTDWSLDERNRLSLSLLKSLRAKFIHKVDYGITVGITRGF